MRFDELDLEDEILDGLDDMNFQEMTPVQEHTIPVILEGRAREKICFYCPGQKVCASRDKERLEPTA
ncbi:MAG: hypothetical protein EGR20_05605 [Alistipes onderdonkii]|nr:hypothetical protein [Alistipes onderdonkii]